MVDAVVSFAVKKLGDFLIQEVSLRTSLRVNVHWLRSELLFMQSFLKHAEEKQVEDLRVQQWVFEVNSIANDAVVILETYEAGEAEFASRLKAYACICRKETKFYNVGKEIKSLKERVLDITRKRVTYGIRDIDTIAGEGPSNRTNNQYFATVRTLRRATSYVDDHDQIFVGFKEVVETLLTQLLNKESHRSVMSIYGMGGLGKTTLAKYLYNSPTLINSFQTCAWICVSQEYSTPDLLRSIIKSVQGRTKETLDLLEKMSERDLESHLRYLLKEQKYLMVVDDVWNIEAWESLKRSFPDSKNGSRVIITTRKEDVAQRAGDKFCAHKLRFLSQEESWDLFCNSLLDVHVMDPEMEKPARDMVGKCGGLPLAIVVLSGLLSHKRGLDEWEKVKAHLWGHLKDHDSIKISDILSLSYNDLSSALKPCFLYFGIYPEDREIRAESIMWLWMADGLVPIIRGEERMEDVAEGFLNELIRRSLIQVDSTIWEKAVSCRIHDLLRELAVQKAQEVNFFDIYDPRKHSLCLRHVIHCQAQRRYLSLSFSNLKLRSLTFFDQENHKLDRSIKFSNMFQHLYVLYLENRSGTMLPDSIGSLYLLKYLSLTGFCKIPSSIGNLKNLQTLHVMDQGFFHTGFCELPPEIANLKNLRHLVASYTEPLQHISKLTSLQVLKGVCCDQWKEVDPVDLVNLQELGMYDIKSSYSLSNISRLRNLSILGMFCDVSESIPALGRLLSSCQNLKKLWLEGRIEKLPLSNEFPKSITMIILSYSKLMDDPMPILGRLPNLRNLDIVAAYEGKEITCNDETFLLLEFFRLADLENLQRWYLSTSAMPRIKGFGKHDCPKLKEIPDRIKDVATLEKLKLY